MNTSGLGDSASAEAPGACRRVVLVGFMASGKSTVGRILARKLGWRFLDLDRAIEDRAEMKIPRIFERHGEAEFRRLEEEVGRELLGRDRVVVSTGGGWGADPDRMDALDPATYSIWLRVELEEALRRTRRSPGTRPLLSGPNPTERARELLADRLVGYSRARHHVNTEGRSPSEVALELADHLFGSGCVPTP